MVLRTQYLKVKKGENKLVFPIPHNNRLITDKKVSINNIKLTFPNIGSPDNINITKVGYN